MYFVTKNLLFFFDILVMTTVFVCSSRACFAPPIDFFEHLGIMVACAFSVSGVGILIAAVLNPSQILSPCMCSRVPMKSLASDFSHHLARVKTDADSNYRNG
jgi:hypothetical protein